jgi:4-hydroxy-tetrahydrodipicolinate synthase
VQVMTSIHHSTDVGKYSEQHVCDAALRPSVRATACGQTAGQLSARPVGHVRPRPVHYSGRYGPEGPSHRIANMTQRMARDPEPLARGVWGVLATPFIDATQAVDDVGLRRQVRLQRTSGSVGLVALGVFGESSSLTATEREHVVRTVSREAAELPLVIGIAERETSSVVDAVRALLRCSGADHTMVMLQIPTSDPKDLAAHLHAVHTVTGAAIVLQDYPVVSGVKISSDAVLAAIADAPFVVAIKSEAPPTCVAIAQLTAGTTRPVFGGLGGLGLLDELMAGSAGAMTGFSHPEALAATVDAWFAGGYLPARDAYLPWLPLVNFEAQPAIGLAIRKAILADRGVLTNGTVRSPALPMPAELAPVLRAHLDARPTVGPGGTWANNRWFA